MNKEQAIAFYAGLKSIELRHQRSIDRTGNLKSCVMVLRLPVTNELIIRPLNGIEKETAIWQEIETLFQRVTAY